MSRSSYTASERRGILAIGIVSLLLIGGGIAVSFLEGQRADAEVTPMVIEHPELLDTIKIEDKAKSPIKENLKKQSTSSKKTKQTYHRRNLLEEPINK